ncbi:MAG: hypothetical protein ABSG75_16385 [Syntrophales bacterium]|jgi:hypothetical protein
MSWSIHHTRSESYAAQANAAIAKGDTALAESLFQLAAQEETLALEQIEQGKKRTLGITAVSAVSLWFKARDLRQVERLACGWLATDLLPDFAITQLQEILQTSWNEKIFQQYGVKFFPGEVLVSVSGGGIVTGGAPLDLIHRKVDEVRSYFYRTIEMLLNRPFRKHGHPSPEIQQQFRPWLIQAPAGSYQFAVRVQKPTQLELFPEPSPDVEEITKKFLEIVDASVDESQEVIEKIVPDPEYRQVFLKLARNLAPTGKTFKRLEIKSATDTEARPIILLPESRKEINESLRKGKKPIDASLGLKDRQLVGILRGLQLDKDWIEVRADGEEGTIRIYQTGDIIDDIVGSMVNHRVIVDVSERPDGKMIFRDIQSEE